MSPINTRSLNGRFQKGGKGYWTGKKRGLMSWMPRFAKGHIPWNKNKDSHPLCLDCRIKLKCYGSKRCRSCSGKITGVQKGMSGIKSLSWKGGKTPLDKIQRLK